MRTIFFDPPTLSVSARRQKQLGRRPGFFTRITCRIRIGSFLAVPENRTASGIICRRCFSCFAALKVSGNFF